MSLATPASEEKVPVVVVTGFLGSGKTTLLNHLLAQPEFRQAGVMINEFGDVPLDGAFLDHEVDGIAVLAGGCLCCVVGDDFEDQLLRIHSRSLERGQPLGSLLVETSGLADPTALLRFLIGNPVAQQRFRLASVTCTVDALFGRQQLERQPEAQRQAAIADRLVITKSDLAPEALPALTALLRALNPRAGISTALQGRLQAALLFETAQPQRTSAPEEIERWLGPDHADHAHQHAQDHEAAQGARHAADLETFTIVFDEPLPWRRLSRWLTSVRVGWSEQLLRVKGLVHCAGESAPLALHGVHHIFHPPVPLPRWPTGERRSRLVFITRGGVRAAIERSWAAAQQGERTAPSAAEV